MWRRRRTGGQSGRAPLRPPDAAGPRRHAAALRVAGPPAERGALPPARAAGRGPQLPPRRLDVRRRLQRALALRPPLLARSPASLSVSAFGWLGRLVFWPLLGLLLIRLGTRFGLKLWPAAVAVTFWLLSNQALIGSEWILGTFEAKTVAYVCFLGALLAVTSKRIPLALALLGLTVSFHPAVGLWSAWATGLALLALPRDPRPTCAGAGSRSCSRSRGSSARSSAVGERHRGDAALRRARSDSVPHRSVLRREDAGGRAGRAARRDARSRCSRSTSGRTEVRPRPHPTVLRRVPDRGRGAVRARVRRRGRSTSGTTCGSCRCGRSRSSSRSSSSSRRSLRLALAAVRAHGSEPTAAAPDAQRWRPRRSSPSSDRDLPHLTAVRRAADDPPQLQRVDHRRPRSRGVRLGARRTRPRARPCIFPVDRQDAFDRAERPQVVELAGHPLRPAARVEARASTTSSAARSTSTGRAGTVTSVDLRAAYNRLTTDADRPHRDQVRRELPRQRGAVPVPAPAPRRAACASTRSRRSDPTARRNLGVRDTPIRRLGRRAVPVPLPELTMIGVIDYRAGNAPSVMYALDRLGLDARLVAEPAGARRRRPAHPPRRRRRPGHPRLALASPGCSSRCAPGCSTTASRSSGSASGCRCSSSAARRGRSTVSAGCRARSAGSPTPTGCPRSVGTRCGSPGRTRSPPTSRTPPTATS